MVKIKYIPNILSKEGREQVELLYEADKVLSFYLGETKFNYDNCNVIINGNVAKTYDIYLKDGDEVIITPQVEGFIAAFFGLGTFWVNVFNTIAVISTILSIAYSIYSAFSARKPSFNTSGEGMDENSPTYGWDGIRNTQDVAIPIPICYGKHPIGGNRIIKL